MELQEELKQQIILDWELNQEELKDATILFYSYDVDGYSGCALVIFRQNNIIYYVEGSHCSCMGLEGQWEPLELTKQEADRFLNNASYGIWRDRKDEIIKSLEGRPRSGTENQMDITLNP